MSKISEELDFNNHSSFSRAFKKKFGISPDAFRFNDLRGKPLN
ncbi:AraC family transcriptional regulator [Acinetobacter sp. Ver3]